MESFISQQHTNLFKKILKEDYGYNVQKTIGQATNFVYRVTKDYKSYALKVMVKLGNNYIKFDRDSASRYKGFKNVVEMLEKVITCQNNNKNIDMKLIPDYIESFIIRIKQDDVKLSCECIITELYDGDLVKLLTIYKKSDNITKKYIKSIIKNLQLMLKIINLECNICFDDIKLDNLLYKYSSKNGYEIVFADTGGSKEFKGSSCSDMNNFNHILNNFN